MTKGIEHIKVLAGFIARQMDGEQPPPAGSAEEQAIFSAIKVIHAMPSDQVLSALGLEALGTVIARMSSSINAQLELMKFIAPGDPS